MSLSVEDYAWLAKDAYSNERKTDVNRKPVTINGHQYKVIDYQASPSGFHATAYQQLDSPHGIVIAFRGTDPSHPLTTLQDGAVDAIMVAGKVNPQVNDAERFTEHVLTYAKQHGIPADVVTVAGHSLGGTLAEIAACKYELYGETFNAYGAAELGIGIPAGGSQVIDNVLASDPVSAAGHQFGTVRPYATTADIEQLQQAGYLDGKRGFLPALHAMRLADHSIDNFAPDPGKGPSVLTDANEARAKEYAPAITRYRDDMHAVRRGLHVAAQPGLPLAGLHAAAWGVEGITAAGLTTSASLGQARDTLEREAVRSAQAVEHTAHAVASETSRAYDATRQGVVHGVHASEHAVSQGVHATEHAAHTLTNDASQAWNTLSHTSSWFDSKLTTSSATTLRLDQATHPDHALYQQARSAVHRLDDAHQRVPDQRSDNLAAALAVAARRDGLNQIHHAVLSDDASHTFAVQGELHSPLRQLAQVQTTQAVNTPIEQSSLAWQQVASSRQDHVQASQLASQQQEQQAQRAHPTLGM